MNIREFGKTPSGERLETINNSPNYRDGSFQNIEPTSVNPKDVSVFKIMAKMASRPSSVRPSAEIPHVVTDLKKINSSDPTVIWFGHSSYFIHARGYNILIDPVFSGNASPFDFFGKAFKGADIFNAEDLPDIDLLVLTHDHYDHLDWPTVKKIAPRSKKIVTSLGVGAHLEYWKVDQKKVKELDWWQREKVFENVIITATPARHFSGRGIHRGKTLWSSFVLDFFGKRIFIGADSGYDSGFSKIGREFQHFDLAFLECGQYEKYWPQIHMFPEQTVMAANDLNAEIIFPVHWSKFVLSSHPWNEPIERLRIAADKAKQPFVAPMIGEPFVLGHTFEQKEWWNFEQKKAGYGK